MICFSGKGVMLDGYITEDIELGEGDEVFILAQPDAVNVYIQNVSLWCTTGECIRALWCTTGKCIRATALSGVQMGILLGTAYFYI